jgi:gamma-glutamyltranspeptidase/glutathione hydrolase
METRGGWITFDDLASVPEPSVIPALTTTYHGFTVASLPPPGGGWVVLQILNLFEVIGPETLRAGAEGRTAAIADALRIGHTNRRENPVHDLINYHASVEKRLDKETARMLWERRTETAAAASAQSPMARSFSAPADHTGETTHFSVVDGAGMAVSVTASINAYFGARAASAALGFLYNDYMHTFELGRPEHPFALGPSRMPYSSMSPTVVSWNGEPVLVLGSPGSARIMSTVAQVAQLWMDGGFSLDAAVAAARIHVIPDDRLYLEGELGHNAARQGQVPLGYTIMDPGNYLAIGGRNAYFGGVHAIGKMDGQWQAVADPRRDGRGVVLR